MTPPGLAEAQLPSESETTGRKRRLIAGLVAGLSLLLLVGLFFNRMAFSNLILARGDTFLYFYPYWQAASDAIRGGSLPLWNTALFMGAPFLANSQAGLLYPLNWPLWLLLPVPYAVSASILPHLVVAGLGTYLAARRCLALTSWAAILAALVFALGGYLTAQVEHVNQLQGLAWLPWFFVALCPWLDHPGRWSSAARTICAVAVLFALQLLAGHTQTAFITGVGLVIWIVVVVTTSGIRRPKQLLTIFGPVLLGALLGAGLAAVQVIPSLELARFSTRQGGLPTNEALSFSLNPLLLTRSLLPDYNQPLFSEYVAILPLTVVLLAVIGAWTWRRRADVRPVIVTAVAGLLLALGIFNPIYHLLVRLPGFDLFRVPARWLALYAFGVALLAGLGWQVAVDRARAIGPVRLASLGRPLIAGLSLLIVLAVWGIASVGLAGFIPMGAEGAVSRPTTLSWILWSVELCITVALLLRAPPILLETGIGLIVVGFLFLATRQLPYNNLTTPEAYFDLRPPITRILTESPCQGQGPECQQPPSRLLSLSDIFFDPGDQAEVSSIYGDQLSAEAIYDYTIAIKQKEIIAPNLPLAYGLASVDGFDGGILPLKSYSDLVSLILPEGKTTTDGRLRENLESVPEARWLDLFQARHLITDKVGDVWRDEVFFDMQFPLMLDRETGVVSVGHVPTFEATELWVLGNGQAGWVEVETSSGDRWRLRAQDEGQGLFRVTWPTPAVAKTISLSACETQFSCPDVWRVDGLSLVDGRDGAFQTLVLGNYRQIHSGDVKIYENLDVLPRAFLVYDWIYAVDRTAAIQLMSDPDFDPVHQAVLVGSGPLPEDTEGHGQASISTYNPDEVTIEAVSELPGLLVLTDAHYPGWSATVDGQPVYSYEADGLFRGAIVPAGEHEVVWRFNSKSVTSGMLVSTGALFVWSALMAFSLGRIRRPHIGR